MRGPIAFLCAVATVVLGDPQPHVCIVGSGIAGSSAAHFLAQGGGVRLSVFEKEHHVGGRMHVFDYRNTTIEAGGTIIHVGNKYMVGFARQLGLELVRPGQHSGGALRMGIYTGDGFALETSTSKIVTLGKMLWRYGPLNLKKMHDVVQRTLDKFETIYTAQDEGTAFPSPNALLTALGLFDSTQTSLEAIMLAEGVSPRLINELMAGITRVNYGQNTTMSGFGGLVGLAGSGDDLRAIAGGSFQIPEGLLREAKVDLHLSTAVTAVTVTSDGKFELATTSGALATCDGVVLAAPQELTQAQLPVALAARAFQMTHTTFVQGELSAAYFGQADVPEIVLTTENASLPFSSIGLQYRKDGVSLYKVFSRAPMTSATLGHFFQPDFTVVKTYPWAAYPTFQVPETFTPFEVVPGLVYPNAIENAASAMEMSALSGRNAALLMQKHLGLPLTSASFAAVKDEL
ncbi:prenylcysteine oxidase-like [Achlya hypogyna]|uniref:Prenylcysteine oxidase-like n=1 Tax=Achlya hypogyna TaxID=1202772 RepID=A0A0A7CN69_ACHHY|nr:secreted protein [Achlya hypogyna]OQR90998.1 prenylcysteine oxidase-like [Achlya hypogyna]